MEDPIPWPSVLVPSAESWSLRGGTRSGGQTFEGNEQIVASPTARWTATLTIPCPTRAAVLAARRVIAQGRVATWQVGPLEHTRAPWNVDFLGGRITAGRGARDGTVLEAGQDTSAALDFRLAGDAAANAAGLVLRREKGGVLEPGMVFSIADRLHVLVDLDGETGTPGRQGSAGARIAATIRPWLRRAHADGTPVEFARPRGTMRLASDETGALDLQMSRFGTVTLDLVEAF